MRTVTFRISKKIWARFTKLAEEQGYRPAEALREAVRRWLQEAESEVALKELEEKF